MTDEEDDTRFSEDFDDLKVRASGVMAVDDDSTVGLLTILTQVGHYDFMQSGNCQHDRPAIAGVHQRR